MFALLLFCLFAFGHAKPRYYRENNFYEDNPFLPSTDEDINTILQTLRKLQPTRPSSYEPRFTFDVEPNENYAIKPIYKIIPRWNEDDNDVAYDPWQQVLNKGVQETPLLIIVANHDGVDNLGELEIGLSGNPGNTGGLETDEINYEGGLETGYPEEPSEGEWKEVKRLEHSREDMETKSDDNIDDIEVGLK